MQENNNFDLLITTACNKYCIDTAKEFLQTDTSGFEITASERRRFHKMLRASERAQKPKTSMGRIIAAACIIVLCASITACVAIPKVREAIKRAVVEWYDKYISIEFVEQPQDSEARSKTENVIADQGTATESDVQASESSESTEIQKPTKIEQKAYASYLPEGYTYEVDLDTKIFYVTLYYQENELKFSITQKTIVEQLAWADSENHKVTYSNVNEYQAILLEDLNDPSLYMLVWQDMQYEYKIEGYFKDTNEITKIAEGIRLQ